MTDWRNRAIEPSSHQAIEFTEMQVVPDLKIAVRGVETRHSRENYFSNVL